MMNKLHHIGIASKNIYADEKFFHLLGYKSKGSSYEDHQANIKVLFMSAEGQPDIELVQNLEKAEGPMSAHLQAKRKIFHFAYEVDDIEKIAQHFVDNEGAIYLVPIQYHSSDESDIHAWCYLYFRSMMIVELVQVKDVHNA